MTSGDHPIRVVDVQIGENKNKILFILRTSKTHWRNVKPQTVKITSTNFKRLGSCPFEIIREFVKVRRCYLSADKPFFIFKDGSPVKPRNMRDTLKLILKRENFKDENYNVHSFRIGRASDLLKNQQISVETLKKIGRWKSNIVYSYLMS